MNHWLVQLFIGRVELHIIPWHIAKPLHLIEIKVGSEEASYALYL